MNDIGQGVMHEDEPHAHSRMRAFGSGADGVRVLSLDEAAARFAADGTVPDGPDHSILWIDIVNPSHTEALFLRERLHLHPLAVEDCVRGRQRPKMERYPGSLFLVFYSARLNPDRDRVAFHELHVFVGEHFIITVRDHRMEEVKATLARWRAAPSHFATVGGIAHALLDEVVDHYFGVIDHFAEHVSASEVDAIENPDDLVLQRLMVIRRELVLFRRIVAPLRDMIGRLLRRELAFVQPELRPYFQDVWDHVVRITEEIDTMRELVATTLENYSNSVSKQLNQTLRMMTAWSIILMSMTLVAGIYGMNFAVMPELTWRWGYAFAGGVMLVLGTSLFLFFRRRDWI